MNIQDVGKFPVDGPSARATGELFKVTSQNCLHTIYGKTYPIKINLFISNDFVHVGEMIIPSGGTGSRASEVIESDGDTVLYVKEGPITFFIPSTQEVFHVEEGDTMFIPEHTPYQLINYSDKVLTALFTTAPNL